MHGLGRPALKPHGRGTDAPRMSREAHAASTAPAASEPPAGPFSSVIEATSAVLDALEAQSPGSLLFVGHLDDDAQRLRVVRTRGDAAIRLRPGDELPADAVHRPLDAVRPLGGRSCASVPLALSSGRWVGSLCAVHPDAHAHHASGLQLLSVLGRFLSAQLEGEAREQELARRSFDRALEREWQLARRGTVRSHLALLEANELAAPGGGDGRAAGDDAVLRLERALRAVARGTDVLARLDGDRFAVILVGCASRHDAQDFRRRLAAELERSGGDAPALGLSMGFEPLDAATSREEALEAAEGALRSDRASRAPGAGRGRLASFLHGPRR